MITDIPFAFLASSLGLLLGLELRSASSADSAPVIVKTAYGPVAGVSRTIVAGKEVNEFFGVPFAKPPVRELRFNYPQEPEPWTEVMNCTELAPACYQLASQSLSAPKEGIVITTNAPRSEDCLKLNLWVPANQTDLPVMIWIFGGGFISGSPSIDDYNGAFFAAERNVIIVNINYRLGPFGFFYVGDEYLPSNVGLLDQQMAMRWVNANIRQFGGDPNQVTLFGQSAGSVSAAAHLLSKNSWPYFNRAILESGTINCPWAFQTPVVARHFSNQLITAAGCTNHTLEEELGCLRHLEAEAVQHAFDKLLVKAHSLMFVPVSEETTFFNGSLLQLLAGGAIKHCQVLAGYTPNEGSFLLPIFLPSLVQNKEEKGVTSEQRLNVLKGILPSVPILVTKTIFEHYLTQVIDRYPANQSLPAFTYLQRDALMYLIGDLFFTCPIFDLLDVLAAYKLPVYLYYFTHRSSVNSSPAWMGVRHGEEIPYVFGKPLFIPKYTELEKNLSVSIMQYWADFATTGNPYGTGDVMSWPVYTSTHRHYMKIDDKRSVMQENESVPSCHYLKQLFQILSKSKLFS